jgi:hypothetical protein
MERSGMDIGGGRDGTRESVGVRRRTKNMLSFKLVLKG